MNLVCICNELVTKGIDLFFRLNPQNAGGQQY
jgi:hypothetical protein